MRHLFATLALVSLLAAACSDDGDDAAPATTTTSTTTTAAPTTTEAAAPGTFCEAITEANLAFDDLTRTMLATMAGDPSGPFIIAVDDTVEILEQAESLAPPEAADATSHLATSYREFEALLFEVDFVPEAIPADDPRASALTDAAFLDAITTVTEVCA